MYEFHWYQDGEKHFRIVNENNKEKTWEKLNILQKEKKISFLFCFLRL